MSECGSIFLLITDVRCDCGTGKLSPWNDGISRLGRFHFITAVGSRFSGFKLTHAVTYSNSSCPIWLGTQQTSEIQT